MKTVFSDRSSRIYCICGNLSDIVCTGSLQKMPFFQYLSEYLKEQERFDSVIYYYSSRGMRTYDAATARELIAENQTNSDEEQEEPEYDPDDVFDENEFKFTEEIPQSQEEEKKKTGFKLKYFSPIQDADFLSLMDGRLRDIEHSSAIVFENIANYKQADSNCEGNYNASLHYFQTNAGDDNHNLVLMLGMNLDYDQIYSLIADNEVLRGIFFREVGNRWSINENHFIYIGAPGKDEIRNLLEFYRVRGFGKGSRRKYLKYPVQKGQTLAYLIKTMMDSDLKLETLNSRLQTWMESQPGSGIIFDEQSVGALFPEKKMARMPIERMEELPYTEVLVARMKALERCADGAGRRGASLNLERFCGQTVGAHPQRYLIVGQERSGKTKAAQILAEFLYSVDEVAESEAVFLQGSQLNRTNSAGELEQWLLDAIRRAARTALVIDDLDALLDFSEQEERLERIRLFHRTMRTALDANQNLCLIMTVGTRKDEVFQGKLDQYEFEPRNIFDWRPKRPEKPAGLPGRTSEKR